MNKLLKRLRPDWKWCLTGLFLAGLQSALAYPTAALLRWAFDVAVPTNHATPLIQAATGLLILRAISSLLACLAHRIQMNVSNRFAAQLRREILAKLFQLPRLHLQQMETGKLQDLMTAEMVRVDGLVRSLLGQVLPYCLVSLALALVLVSLDFRLFAMMMLLWPATWLLNEFFRRRAHSAAMAYNKAYRQSLEHFRWLVDSLDFVRAHHAESLERERGEREFSQVEQSSLPMSTLNVDYLQIQAVLLMALSLAVLLYGGIKVSEQSLTVGSLFSFFLVVGLLNTALREVAVGLYHVVVGQQSLQAVFAFLETPINLPYQGEQPLHLTESLEMRQVSFCYHQEEPLLEGLCLTLRPGRQIALTGANGSGKSTLVSLLLGFIAPDQGALYADGIEYGRLDIGHLRAQLGVVSQDPLVFAGTIWENLSYARAELSEEQAWSCLRLADAEEWVSGLAQKLQTPVGHLGCRLSGGQRQKLAIARALCGDPKFLILDEPTNHLDLRAVGRLLQNLRGLSQSPAVLLVTHDEGVAGQADEILCLDKR